jgi:hypothetical protein
VSGTVRTTEVPRSGQAAPGPAGGGAAPGPRHRGGEGPGGAGRSRAARVSRRGRARRAAGSALRRALAVPRGAGAVLRGTLLALRAAIVLLAAALLVLLAVAGLSATGAWHAMAGADAPRVISATGLNLAVNDMDAQVANTLLASGDAGRGALPVPHSRAVQEYGTARKQVSTQLGALAVAAEGDGRAEATVDSLTEDFARYQEDVGRALEDDGRPGGRPAAVGEYRKATGILADHLQPESQALVDSTDSAFLARYKAAHARLAVEEGAAVALGVLLLAALLYLQWFLASRFGRTLSPWLLASTCCALVAALLGPVLLSATSGHMRVARHDSFDSVVALSRAKAIAYDANADESRYLLIKDARVTYQSLFMTRSQQLFGVGSVTQAGYAGRLEADWRAYRNDHRDLRFTGEFRRELDNITFPGERAAAEKDVEAYDVYQRDDQKIRRLVASGDEQGAVAFGIGWDPHESNEDFALWMRAMQHNIDVNQAYFDSSVADGGHDLDALLPLAGVALLAAVALAVAGVRPRLAEYRA